MKPQTIVTPKRERLILIPEAAYLDLLEAAEDAADIRAVEEVQRKMEAGEEELVPSHVVDRLLSDEKPVIVWRERRGMSRQAFAEKAGIGADLLARIEAGGVETPTDVMRKIAGALALDLDDLVGPAERADAEA